MSEPVAPILLTFDIFGTVLDWRRGLREALRSQGAAIDDATFDRVLDRQAELEHGPFRLYAEIVAISLVEVVGIDATAARGIGDRAGEWPLYPDSSAALARLMRIAPCVATTNSDLAHRAQIEAQLGFPLSDWVCAEELRIYKPDEQVWHRTAARLEVPLDRAWWHVSAYGDYDLVTAARLGLTGVYVTRPHARPGPAQLEVATLLDLANALPEPL